MTTDYRIAQKVLHWLVGLLIMLDLFVAQKFGNPMELADRLESRIDHGSLGIIMATLFAIRLWLRIRHGAPAQPAGTPPWQAHLASAAH